MNNANMKLAIVVSFSLGGALGYLIAKKTLKEHYDALSQEEIDDVKSYFLKKYGEINGLTDTDTYRKVASKYSKPNLHDLATSGIEADDEELEEEDQEVDEEEKAAEEMEAKSNELAAEADPNKEPYLIDYQSFCKPSDVYDKVSLYYYRFDDVVCDVNDKVVEEPEDTLGWEYITELGRRTTAFIRNEKLKIDYEIHSFSKSYNEEVKVKLETDTERKYRRMARQKKAVDDIGSEYMEEDEESVPVQKPRSASTGRHISPTKKFNGNHKVSTKDLLEDEESDDDEEE